MKGKGIVTFHIYIPFKLFKVAEKDMKDLSEVEIPKCAVKFTRPAY